MAWYSNECVWFRGRKVEVTFRYGCYMNARVVAGKPLRFASDREVGNRRGSKGAYANTRGLLRVLRRKKVVDERGNLSYDPYDSMEET